MFVNTIGYSNTSFMDAKHRIVIADNDASEVAFFAEAMRSVLAEFDVQNARDGGECIRMLKNDPSPEIIFLDLEMPVKNGTECLKSLRAMPHFDHTPIIVFSKTHNYRDIDKCYKLGANYYLVKPDSKEEMVWLFKQLFSTIAKHESETKQDQFVLMHKV